MLLAAMRKENRELQNNKHCWYFEATLNAYGVDSGRVVSRIQRACRCGRFQVQAFDQPPRDIMHQKVASLGTAAVEIDTHQSC